MEASSQGNDSANNFEGYYDTIESQVQQSDAEFHPEYEQLSPLREQDRFLPIANVSKIMKKAVPANGKISKEAKEMVQECVSEYISFITSEAAEKCQQEKRKTINGEDLLWAMSNLGFDPCVEPLRLFLTKYREANKLDSTMLEDNVLEIPPRHHHQTPHHQTIISADQSSVTTGTTLYTTTASMNNAGEYVTATTDSTDTVSSAVTTQALQQGTIALATDDSGNTSIYLTYPSVSSSGGTVTTTVPVAVTQAAVANSANSTGNVC